ncbi:Ankyrin repeat-containing domain [Trypanosoma melophagium]|uniref:Ankyrin repeat-containing domain n=1 Tax=Trypanosoma melophagium TaxID=715481 RepID=UPI00351A66AD|nr:Ankyrin repeat-containing domain [Trypanosoma melophagium]
MQKPLSDEERAAKEARLQQLREEMNARGGVSSSTAEAHNEPTNTCENGDEGSSSENEDWEDEFMREMEREQESGGPAVCMYTQQMEELMGETVETGTTVRRSTVGDFELLRLAKMGDLFSFKEFASLMGIDPVNFRDNHERNALHYAADSGSLPMIKYLIEMKVPFTSDEKMMTPLDIAALNKHKEAVELILKEFPQAAQVMKSHEDAVEAFMRQPPKFTMSKPAPPPLQESRPRAFWKSDNNGVNTINTPDDVTVTQLNDAQHELVASALNDMSLTHESHGLHNWLPPTESAALTAVLPRSIVVGAMRTTDGNKVLTGSVLAVPLGGSLVGKKGAVKISNPFLITQLAVHPSFRGANIAALMMIELEKLIKSAGGSAVVFRSSLQLPVQAIGMVKWSRRAIAPCSVFKRRHAAEVFPDFFQYDDVLRADIITKNALTRAFRAQKVPHSKGWCVVDRSNRDQVKLVYEFMLSNVTNMFELAYVPATEDDVLASVITDGISAFVYVSPTTGAITDLVVLRVRDSVGKKDESKSVVQCVYAIFTSFKGAEKAEEILILAELLDCETVLIPNMFGFVDSDLSKAMFEELLHCREYLYALKSTTESVMPPTPLSKVAISSAFI